MNTCRSCQARIVWAVTTAGKRMPLDAEPVERDGAVLAAHRTGPDQALAVRPITPTTDLWPDEHPARSHYATCPNADQHRTDTTRHDDRTAMPSDAVVWCERCRRWTRRGQAYTLISPGKFTHRGPCTVAQA